jgi:3-oxoacyl-(acyl-carrier-protein) synthase/thioesterase domain-containing protein/NAD(P)-dependent dehydrogenase (short-subunit alcohol dehydrogenase family)/aryl carrier-like protein
VPDATDAGSWLPQAVGRLAGRQVGEDENFFDAGLSSLALMHLHSEAIAGPYPELSLSELFDNPTVALLDRHLAQTYGRPAARARSADPLPAGGGAGIAASELVAEQQIAIIGMAVDLPGAPDLGAFWSAIESGRDCIERRGEPRAAPGGAFVPAVSMLADPLGFDAAWFGLPAHEARLMDPQQRVLLMVAASALANAGIEPTRARRKSIGVAVSASENSYLRRIWEAEQAGEKIDPFLVSLLNEKDMLSSRLAYHFNLSGPALTVQTACSSSLTAIHLACDQLRAGTCDLFLAGGVCVDLSKADGYVAPKDSIYSADGYCRTFSDDAGGTVPASGAVMLLLKPLAAALRDKDRIYAVVRGSAVNNDGSQKVNIAAPSEKGQIAVIAAAQAAAGVRPGEIGYVETHGTGTRLGDPIEFRALAAAFGDTKGQGSCALGSLKSQMGHLGAAAGAAGVARAALCVYHGVKPATLHPTPLNAQIKLDDTPFVLLDRAERWEAGPRIAGVSSFGIGGANAHALIGSPPSIDPRSDLPAWDAKPIAFERRPFDIGKPRSSSAAPRDPDGWYYQPSWVPVGESEMAALPEYGEGVVALAGRNEAAVDRLAQALGRAGRRLAVAKDEAALSALFAGDSVKAVVYCPGGDLTLESHDDLRAVSDQLIEAPIRIVRSWNEVKSGEPLRLVIATEGFDTSPGLALAQGPQAVLPVEHRHVSASIVDIAAGRADAIVDVLDGPPGVYAVREGVLHARRLVPVAGLQAMRRGGIEPGDVVVVTGGLGGVGRQLAEAILEVADTRVVLLGRTAGGGEIDPAARMTELRCDVTDKADVANAVRAIRYNFGKIRGVVHAAGLPGSGLVDFNGPEDRLAVLAPKVLGATALQEALRSDPPRFVLHCSSLSAFFGMAGQVDYSAANAFLDAVAAAAARDAGSAVLSVAWPSWEGTGMAATVGQRGQAAPEGLQISPTEGRSIFLKALASGRPQLAVSPLRPNLLAERLFGAAVSPAAEPEVKRARAQGGDLKPLVRAAFLAALEHDRVDDSVSFFDQGGDSWSAMILVSTLQGDLDPSLGMSELIANPSVDALAQRLSDIQSRPGPQGPAGTIVRMKGGQAPPVIFFHPIGGGVIGYREVVARIADREVLAVASAETLDPSATLEAQASGYRKELPQGRAATLVGWSYGALLAWEVARQIEAEGGRVEKLILVDPPLPCTDEPDQAPPDFEQIALRELHPADEAQALPGSTALASSPEARSVVEACRTNTGRLLAYRPAGKVRCPAVVAVATERPSAWGATEAVLAAWQDHLENIETCMPLPGGHYDCVRGQNAEIIARLLQDE